MSRSARGAGPKRPSSLLFTGRSSSLTSSSASGIPTRRRTTTTSTTAPRRNNNNKMSSIASSSSPSSPSMMMQQQQQQRPSLLSRELRSTLAMEIAAKGATGAAGGALPWQVGDTRLRPVPAFYPPLVATCTTFVGDAPPSVVAARISDCLAKKSVSAEYDNEMCTATCMTVDRVHFTIQLFRGDRRHTAAGLDFSHGVIVEVVRQQGSTLSFHRNCRAVLNAAKGYYSGEPLAGRKRRHVQETSTTPFEFNHFLLANEEEEADSRNDDDSRRQEPKRMRRTIAPLRATRHSLDNVWSLLSKDRMGAQQLGMESLVMLLDPLTSGEEVAVPAAKMILSGIAQDDTITEPQQQHELTNNNASHEQLVVITTSKSCFAGAGLKSSRAAATSSPVSNTSSSAMAAGAGDGPVPSIHRALVRLIQERVLPGESEDDDGETRNGSKGVMMKEAAPESVSLLDADAPAPPHVPVTLEDPHHGGIVRSLGLRCLANALQVMVKASASQLRALLVNSPWESRWVLQALAEDLLGAQRPPLATVGTRLASVHEAALAARILKMIAQHSTVAQHKLVNPKNKHHPTLELLLKCSTHGGGINLAVVNSSTSNSIIEDELDGGVAIAGLDVSSSITTTSGNVFPPHHAVLQQEVTDAYKVLSQDVRTC